MRKKLYVFAFISLWLIAIPAVAQKVYTVTSGEIILSRSDASYTQAFMTKYPGASFSTNDVRFTMFFHAGEYVHYDFTNNFGLFSGLAVRNIGMITDETLPQSVAGGEGSVHYAEYKIIKRQYALGVPLALKIGAFNKHLYFFGGGEYEMAFQFKEKFWTASFDRSGPKTKDTKWFSSQTPTFMPSVFGGVQLPGGVNIRFKYYLTDFLNPDYKGNGNNVGGAVYDISDNSRYEQSKMFYLSICWQFNPADLLDDK